MRLVRSAGGIVWRETASGPRLAVVHRARRDDWSLPKGKLEPGEGWRDAARREITEETGCAVRLGRFAGAKLYVARPEPKLVLYWHAWVVREGSLAPESEVDEVAWLSRHGALDRLDHTSDRQLVLRALGGSRSDPWRDREARAGARLGPDGLRRLVVLDSRKAEEELSSVLGLISAIVGATAGSIGARRA